MRSFKIYGIWPKASKQASKNTHARAQCSHASVGLAQARSNNILHGCMEQFNELWLWHHMATKSKKGCVRYKFEHDEHPVRNLCNLRTGNKRSVTEDSFQNWSTAIRRELSSLQVLLRHYGKNLSLILEGGGIATIKLHLKLLACIVLTT